MKIRHLAWDSNFFGYKIAKISNINPDTKLEVLKNNIKTAGKKGYQCLYLAIPPNAQTLITYCHSNDFKLIGLKTTLIKKNLNLYKLKKQIKDEKDIRLLPGLLSIARQISNKSRFAADAILNNKTKKLYEEWINNIYSNEFSDKFYYNVVKSIPAGLISIRLKRGLPYIDLFGVDERFKRQGVGTELLRAAENWTASQGYQDLRVTTQESNTEALQFYQRNGFITDNVNVFYHKWIKENVQDTF